MAANDTQRETLQAFDMLFGPRSQEGQRVLAALTIFVQQEKDPMVRSGRADVLLYISRSVQRAHETPVSQRGDAEGN